MIGDNIRKYRKINNMSQEELADRLDVTRQSISLWENGQTQPSIDNIVALAKLFNVTTDDLLIGGDGASPYIEKVGNRPNFEDDEEDYSRVHKPLLTVLLVVLVGIMAVSAVIAIKLILNRPGVQTDAYDLTSAPTSEATTTPAVTTSAVTTAVPVTPKDPNGLFAYLKSWVVANGTINGDFCYYANPSSFYGGFDDENFALYYWGDTDTIEFSLHCTIDDTYSICYYLRVPKEVTAGQYEYVTSYYYRKDGVSVCEAKGTIDAALFTSNYPLSCSKYVGSSDLQNDFMETSRVGICNVIFCLKHFVLAEKLDYSFSDFGFRNF